MPSQCLWKNKYIHAVGKIPILGVKLENAAISRYSWEAVRFQPDGGLDFWEKI
jgi:hypothetical protein